MEGKIMDEKIDKIKFMKKRIEEDILHELKKFEEMGFTVYSIELNHFLSLKEEGQKLLSVEIKVFL